MALLPEDPKKQRALLVVILALAAGTAFYLYVFKRRAVEITEAQERIEELTFQNDIAERRIGNLQELRDRLALGERQYTALKRLVPPGSEVPEIYEAIATEAQATNLRLLAVTPAAPVQDSGSYFQRQQWQMQVEGEYHMLGEFLARVAAFDRIVRPEISDLSAAQRTPAGRQLVRANFLLETYVIPADTTHLLQVASPAGEGEGTEE